MIKELQEAFKNVVYLDSKHQYFSNGVELESVTKFLSSLKPKFQSEFWSTVKAYEFSGFKVKSIWNNFTCFRLIETELLSGVEETTEKMIYLSDDHSHLKVTPEDVRAQWEIDSLVGRTRGSFIHDYVEKLEMRILDQPITVIPPGLDTGQGINYFNSLKTAKELCAEFLEYAKENLILIAAEFSVGSESLGLAGRFDRLYFNKLTEKYEVWDFKTDKQIRYKSGFGKLAKFDLPDCEFEKYSLQVSLYKKIIQDATGVELGESKIVWFNLKERKYEIIPTKDYVELINTVLN